MSELNMGVKDDKQQIVLDSEGRVVSFGNGNDLIQNSPEHRPLFRSAREMKLEEENIELKRRLSDAPRLAAIAVANKIGEAFKRCCCMPFSSINADEIETTIRAALAGKEKK